MIRQVLSPGIFIITFLSVFAVHSLFMTKNFRNTESDVIVKITRGENLRSVASKLENSNVIFNKTLFLIVGRVFGFQNKIIPGQYTFQNGLSNIQILNLITNPGIIRTVTITIPEGMTIRQMGRLLHRQMNIDSARFVEEAKNDSLLKILGIKADNLEGYLFPNTYDVSFGTGSNEREIIKTMFTEFRKRLTPEILDGMKKKKLTLVELITMASIIEAETKHDPEKKIIAGVYYNRLKRKLKLEADPTVQYVLPDGPKKRLLFSDLKYQSPYNTYLYKGLPPGPINNPGWNSILAALYPDEHKYLYFAAKGDGSHRFAESFDEHRKNADLYRQYLDSLEKSKEKK